MSVEAVLFDVDGVLVNSREANAVFYQRLMTQAGYDEPAADTILALFHLPLTSTVAQLAGTSDLREVKRIERLADNPDIWVHDLYQYPESLVEDLEEMHEHYKLGITTSRSLIAMQEIFEAVPMRHLFETLVTFEDCAHSKPHPEPVQLTIGRLGVKASRAVFVGDSFSDVESARGAGVRSIHLSKTPHPDATVVVEAFSEVKRAVNVLHTERSLYR